MTAAPVWNFGGRKYANIEDYGTDLLMPYTTFMPLTANGSPFAGGIPRAIFADQAGTATITDSYGNVCEGFPLAKGENRILISAISNLSTTTAVFGAF